MHISLNNVIRFPTLPAPVAHHEPQERRDESAEIVAFSSDNDMGLRENSQEHGQIFTAHRIVTRVADQLDAVAAL